MHAALEFVGKGECCLWDGTEKHTKRRCCCAGRGEWTRMRLWRVNGQRREGKGLVGMAGSC